VEGDDRRRLTAIPLDAAEGEARDLRHSVLPTIFSAWAGSLVPVVCLVLRPHWHHGESSAKHQLEEADDMAETTPGTCERCGVYALLRHGYPYCATCLIILAEGKHYLFTVGG
jgi:hypothetical protein